MKTVKKVSVKRRFSSPGVDSASLFKDIADFLDGCKAEDIVSIDLKGKSSVADFLIIATGRSQPHLKSTADKLKDFLLEKGIKNISIEGLVHCDWVLVDAGDIVIHIFRPEIREFYNLEKMWGPSFSDT